MKCPICNRDTNLVEAVGEEEIIQICETCADKNNFPIIRKPSVEQIKNMSRYQTVKERLSESVGLDLKKHERKDIDKELEKLVVQNLDIGEKDDLVENFHWVIQQGRRMKKISQKQLAEAIAEPEILIEMAEKSKLPENYQKFIGKLEQYLGVRLFTEKKKVEGDVELDKIDLNITKIGDLKKIHEEKFSEEEREKKQILLDDVANKLEQRKEKKKFWHFSGE
jgi:ribosome-binding protein aMBF1 (putative translation factor)